MKPKGFLKPQENEGGEAPFNTYFVCNTSDRVTVRPVRGHLTPKMNIDFFIKNLMLNIFLFNNFFEKKATFSEKPAKNCFGGAFDNFLGKECVLRRVYIGTRMRLAKPMRVRLCEEICRLFGIRRGSESTLHKRIVREFPLMYRQWTDSIRLFAERSSHSRMLFALLG